MSLQTTHKIAATRSGGHPTMGDWDVDYEITFEYRRGDREVHAYGVMNAEPDEVTAIDIKHAGGGPIDDARTEADALDWAQLWLDDAGYDEAIQIATSDLDAGRNKQEGLADTKA